MGKHCAWDKDKEIAMNTRISDAALEAFKREEAAKKRQAIEKVKTIFPTTERGLPKAKDVRAIAQNYEFETYYGRHEYIDNYGFVLLTRELIHGLVDTIMHLVVERELIGSKIVELGAGQGWITFWINRIAKARCLRDTDLVKAIDNGAWETKDVGSKQFLNSWVERADAVEYVKNEKPDIVIMCWPHPEDAWATEVARNLPDGTPIIYIGEGWGGCCAEDSFWKYTEEWDEDRYKDEHVNDKVEEAMERAYKGSVCWDGIHDYPELLKSKQHAEESE
jgi:hypothetical protein